MNVYSTFIYCVKKKNECLFHLKQVFTSQIKKHKIEAYNTFLPCASASTSTRKFNSEIKKENKNQ
jgi:hypothetical protein